MPKLYDPKRIKPMNTHLFFFFMIACSLMVDIAGTSTVEWYRTFILCMHILSFPIIATFVDFVEIRKGRRFIKSFFPESCWSD